MSASRKGRRSAFLIAKVQRILPGTAIDFARREPAVSGDAMPGSWIASRALIRLAGYPLLWNPLQRLLDQQIREERERRELEVWIFDDQIYVAENDESTMRLIDDYFKENRRDEPETDGGEG